VELELPLLPLLLLPLLVLLVFLGNSHQAKQNLKMLLGLPTPPPLLLFEPVIRP
jgi:hypothetical protein